MGVVNVTPDSFSDGGEFLDTDAAIGHGLLLREQGADWVDIGGESTRPGASRPEEPEELRRIIPVVTELAAAGVPVSIDTMRSAVAEAAIAAGATLVNDVSGGLADPRMGAVVADAEVTLVCMHWRAHSAQMQDRAHYDDVVAEVCAELQVRVDALLAAGVDPDRLILDPGLGFAKLPEHNWALLRRLDAIAGLGFPVLVGTSRKRFLGVVGRTPGAERVPAARDVATAVTSAYAAAAGVWGVRVHDVVGTRDAFDVVEAMSGDAVSADAMTSATLPSASPPPPVSSGATS